MLMKGCEGFLAYIVETRTDEPKLEDIPVVCEFADVFPEDLPGLPSDREVEFVIDLLPDTRPISKAPYRMAPVELKELNGQLKSCLRRGSSDRVCHHGELLFCLSRRRMGACGCALTTVSSTRP
ncbi:hypothetical protein Dimus_038926 [Dionaea muscipula]